MTTPPKPPPGWYPDPRGGISQRWWDGDDWAESMPDAAIPAAPKSGWSKEVKAAVFVGGTVVVALALVVTSLASSGDDQTTTSASSSHAGVSMWGNPSSTKLNDEQLRQHEEDMARYRAAQEAEQRALLDPANYQPVSEHAFALIVKDPSAHTSEKLVVYGEVTQFDAATGTKEFRANTGPLPPGNGYYTENTYITAAANPSIVADVVNRDLLKMYVTVIGAYSYDTTLGGHMTVPKFQLNIVEHLGQA